MLGGAGTSRAQTAVPTRSPNIQSKSQFNYELGIGPSLDDIALQLGISVDDFREELRLGKTPKQVLTDQGFTPAQVQKVFTTATSRTKMMITKPID